MTRHGRPRLPEQQAKSVVLRVLITQPQYDSLDERATREGIPISELVRRELFGKSS